MPALLIADDAPTVRQLLRAVLLAPGRELLEAADGDEAFCLIMERRPRVAILDLSMPKKTGLEVCRAVRAVPLLAGTVLIILTANGNPEDVRAAQEAGADFFVTKPFSPSRLLEVVALAEAEAARTTLS